MNTHIIQLLQGLCSDGLWRYAIFWSFKSEMNGWSLTWGDGYVDKMVEYKQVGNLSAVPTVSKNQIVPSSCPIEAALLKMSSHLYPLGEGIIGKVALTGQHCWISSNELCSVSMHNYREDWLLQFAAGIKTVLLVPVVPHGVLQLGSLDMVFESSALVTLIKDLFHELYDAPVSHTSLSAGSADSYTFRPPTATLSIDHPDVNLFEINSAARLLNDHLSLTQPFTTSEFPTVEDSTIGSYRISPTGRPDGLLGGNEIMKYEYSNGFTLTDMAHGYQENTCGDGSTVLNDCVDTCGDGSTVLNDGVVISSPIDSEYHRDLMAMSREEHELFIWHTRLKHTTSPTPFQVNGDNADFCMQLETNNYAEMLLDTIIDQIGHTSNSESSHPTDPPLCQTIIKKDHAPRMDESSVPDIPGGQELSHIPMNEGFISCAMTDASATEINKSTTQECIVRNTHGTNSAEIKKRRSNVESQRPRPRDRQLIQDRMKGLRELIPNASTCSIDALLDKTMAYMLFLQSVSEKAEKELHDETKKQLESCPLRVEELDQPGHLLIKMLCEDYEVFLEMAHVLKGLDLRILKGVLEHRSAKLWASFVIEASGGLSQMQILCPLMHLLHRRWS
ncbi:transcription factor EMB1444-like isoform X1 [Panicum virgatum]|uniref:transcription factor EMB1444-like isoform X1 n=1 Tax=Panicum virgatum TaxID=38727 RepID=UPI0019D53174|nr:transcription factor EMB1444-like isoform X1 [Panicum virgatum]